MGHAMSAEEVKHHVRVYLKVFVTLAVLTVVTVAIAGLNLSTPMAVLVALIVASVKGTLVACYFMHLISERGLIFSVLAICAAFFVLLLLVPALTESESVFLPKAHAISGAVSGGH